MKEQKFNPKAFLSATVLSPLESIELKGGMATGNDGVVVKQVVTIMVWVVIVDPPYPD